MTEKDAVKCGGTAGPQHWYLEIEADIGPHHALRLSSIVEAALRRSN